MPMPINPPEYSPRPSDDEETIAYSPPSSRLLLSSLPQGTFTKEWAQARVVLMDQEEGAQVPSYGRCGRIIGEIGLKYTSDIVNVTAKLTGEMQLSAVETGYFDLKLFSESELLWDRDLKKKCPSVLPIFFQIPTSYEAAAGEWELPPSVYLAIPNMVVVVEYTLRIMIARINFLGFWTRHEELCVPVEYFPRARPVRAVQVGGSVVNCMKRAPDEWRRIMDRVYVFQGKMTGIECEVILPSIRTFGIRDRIPFHLGLRGLPIDRTVRVVIQRQIVMEVHGRRKTGAVTIGEGRMWSDGEGYVSCGEDVNMGGFVSSHLRIEDGVVISIRGSSISQGIRLVTDMCSE